MASSSSDESDCLSQPNQAHVQPSTGSSDSSSPTDDEDDFEQVPDEGTPPKKLKAEWGNNYSNTAMRLMERMGYDSSKGLGKKGQGILKPVEASTQEGRRGLGLKLEGIDAAAVTWDSGMEEIAIPERMDWLVNEVDDLYDLDMDYLKELIVMGEKKLTIDDETKFCDPQVLKNVLSSKSIFDNLGGFEMRRARTRCNPFETIRGTIFLNRAAVKMANIDSLCGSMFTNPVDENDISLIKDNDLLYFADVCAGPGGFSEYVLYRKRWEAKGFGFTLRGDNDFKIDDFYAGPPETFDPYYGVKDDGNIFDPENIESFTDYVLRQTDTGVHFVMADGGFSVEGQENIQEILSKQLYLCQCLVALSILREKGHFVVKLFDVFTPFTVGLIYLMHKCFQQICICKPNTSRPANSERYLICKWKKPQTSTIQRHLFDINQEIFQNNDNKLDILELVRYDVLKKDKKFYDYIVESNNRLGQNQIVGLVKIAAFCNDPKLKETRQAEFKKRCLELWDIPDRIRQAPEKISNDTLLSDLLSEWKTNKEFLLAPAKELTNVNDLKRRFVSIYDWYFLPIGREESSERNVKTFFLCKGRGDVLMYTQNGNWQHVRDCCFDITPKTLIYGEIVTEMIGEGRSQNKVHTLHIIDGIVLGGKDIRRYSLKERLKMCEKFAKALNKPYKQSVAPIRSKKLFPLIEIKSFFDQMKLYKLKDGNLRLGFRIRTDDSKAERFFVPGGLIFFNENNPRFSCRFSKRHNHFYYIDTEKNESFYIEHHKNPAAIYASFRTCFNNRLLWKWVNIFQVDENVTESNRESNLLYRCDFNQYLQEVLPPDIVNADQF